MPHSKDLTAKIRIIGLVASFVAVAAIGLTIVADRGLSGTSARSERTFLLAVAGVLCVANVALVSAHRAQARRTEPKFKDKPDVEG